MELEEKEMLIQRLKKPTGKINPFSFGAGYKNAGLSDDAANILKDIWSFDYMGSAAFEKGSVPDALSNIWIYAHEDNIQFGSINPKNSDKEIYYLCESGLEKDVEEYINALALEKEEDGYKNPLAVDESKLKLKEHAYLNRALSGESDVCGWLAIDPAFMFFTDKKMYVDALNLFGYEIVDLD